MATSSTPRPSDVDIMMFLDGELDGAEAKVVARYLKESEEGAQVAASLGQVSELVRGSVELAADAAEDKLAGLWAGIDKALNSNGVSKDAPEASQDLAPVVSIQQKSEAKATDALVDKAGWFGGWGSHLMIGALAAAAAFALMYGTRSDEAKPAVAEQSAKPETPGQTLQPKIVPVALRSHEPEVEALEVYDGSGVIMTVPGDADGDQAASAVIWISSDTDVLEDPI